MIPASFRTFRWWDTAARERFVLAWSSPTRRPPVPQFSMNTRRISGPTTTMLFADSWISSSNKQNYMLYMPLNNVCMSARHNERFNIAFVDGHAAAQSPVEFHNMVRANPRDYAMDYAWGFYIGDRKPGLSYNY